jgi:two-component system, NtrC family, response regulator AtoC
MIGALPNRRVQIMNAPLPPKYILIVEDDPDVRKLIEVTLASEGRAIECAVDGEDALRKFHQLAGQIALVLLDVNIPRRDGIAVVKDMRSADPLVPIIVMSGVCTPRQAVEAIQSGATDFVAKPFRPDELRRMVEAAIKPQSPALTRRGEIDGMSAIDAAIDQVAGSDVPILLQGESGVGKEVLARRLHAASSRSSRPFVKINCAALPSELLESELFGHERGAFTGADRLKAGMFELAQGGVLLLDEIGDMDVRLQAKLLQVLQDHEFRRVGGSDLIKVDVRIFAATHRNLEQMIGIGEFRTDLYYRLNVIAIRIPPLRQRRDEILPLARQFWVKHAAPGMAPEIPRLMEKALLDYDWPGNVRELENVIRRFLVLQNADLIALELSTRRRPVEHPAPPEYRQARPGNSATALGQVEADKRGEESRLILDALNATNWNRRRAAVRLQIDYRALLYKMRRLSIGEPRPGASDAARSADHLHLTR